MGRDIDLSKEERLLLVDGESDLEDLLSDGQLVHLKLQHTTEEKMFVSNKIYK